MKKMKKRKGFTIVELVIVIAVIAILATTLVPTFGNVIQRAQEAKDIQTVKNMNTALAIYGATMSDEPMANALIQDIDDVMAALADAGFDTYKELTPACADHTFYWYRTTNQMVYVNEKDAAFKLVYPEISAFPPSKDETLTNVADYATDAPDADPEDTQEPDEQPETPVSTSFMHISFDDVQNCFNNLKNNSYNSLFDEPFFAWLKDLHDEYGAEFSLYVYGDTLSDVPNTYAAEFSAASDWLKLGLHAANSGGKYDTATYEYGKSQWDAFVANVKSITGTVESVDRFPRLHYFAGSEAALQGMRDAEYGALGFLTADGERASYYLSDEVINYLFNNDHITDNENDLIFLATDVRGDWFEDINNINKTDYKNHHTPVYDNAYDELVYRYTASEYESTMSSIVFFAHEWKIYNGTSLNSYTAWIEDACKFAKDYGVSYQYPQEVTFSATEYDIPETVEPPVPEKETVMFNGQEATVVDSIYDMEYIGGYSINGAGAVPKQETSNKGRCVSVYYVLRVKGGEMLKLNTTTLNGAQLNYAVLEFKDAPLSSTTVNTNGEKWLRWTQEDIVLQEDTQFVVLGFKKGDASVEFTTDELEQLRTCLDVWEFNTVDESEWYWFGSSKTGFQIQVNLKTGDIVDFSEENMWTVYKYAIGKGTTTSDWIKDGDSSWRSGAYTITEDGTYTIYVRDKGSVNGTITESDKTIIAEKTGYWRKMN